MMLTLLRTCQAILRFTSTRIIYKRGRPDQAILQQLCSNQALVVNSPSELHSSSFIPHMSAMAYPLPRFGAVPKTPMMDDGTPHEVKPRTRDTITVCKQYLAYAVMTVMLLLWVRSWVSSSKKTDKVPFTHDPIEKYCYPPSWISLKYPYL